MSLVKPLVLSSTGKIRKLQSGDAIDPAGFPTSFIGRSIAIYKAADESVSSSTTLQADDHFTFAVAPYEVIEGAFAMQVIANSSGGFKLDMTAPSGATGKMKGIGGGAAAFDSVSISTGYGVTSALTSTVTVIVTFKITNGANAGNITLRWAQNASFGTATIVKEGCCLNATRTA